MKEYKCMVCGITLPNDFSYCPDCGSKIQYVNKVSPFRNKLLLILTGIPIILAVVYIISPIDFVPDFAPIVGWIDDTFVGIFGVSLSALIKGVSKTISSKPFLKKIPATKSGLYSNMFLDKKGYPRFKDSGKLVHRAVAKNKVGGRIFQGYDVHHIDGNKMNFRKSNLRLIEHSNHSKLHWLKRNNK